jgi:hypothetical protein
VDEPVQREVSPVLEAPERFYAHGTVCRDCGYSLAGCQVTACPECGAITVDLAYPGIVRDVFEKERRRAEGMTLTTNWWAVLAAAKDGTGQITGVLVLIGILAFVVYPLIRSVDRMPSPAWAAVRAAGALAGVLGVFAISHAGITWRRVRRSASARCASLATDLAEGRSRSTTTS